MNIGLFACIIQLNNESIDSYAGLAKKNPLLAFFMSIILFSMAGIPPFAGFFAKFYLLYATIKSGMIYLAIIAILASLISAYYYLKLIKVIYFDEAKKEIEINNNYDLLLIALICVIFIVLYLLFSEKITMLISKITECLL
jgi:NADH-quinone oxidoreductase subunit N